MTRQRTSTTIIATVAALAGLVIMLFPLYAVFIGSFENTGQLDGSHYNFLPPTPTLANYRTVIAAQAGHVGSTLILAIGTIGLLILPAASLMLLAALFSLGNHAPAPQ